MTGHRRPMSRERRRCALLAGALAGIALLGLADLLCFWITGLPILGLM